MLRFRCLFLYPKYNCGRERLEVLYPELVAQDKPARCTSDASVHIQWGEQSLRPSGKIFRVAQRKTIYKSRLHHATFLCPSHAMVRLPSLVLLHSGEFFIETIDEFVSRMIELDLNKKSFDNSNNRAEGVERSRYRAAQSEAKK